MQIVSRNWVFKLSRVKFRASETSGTPLKTPLKLTDFFTCRKSSNLRVWCICGGRVVTIVTERHKTPHSEIWFFEIVGAKNWIEEFRWETWLRKTIILQYRCEVQWILHEAIHLQYTAQRYKRITCENVGEFFRSVSFVGDDVDVCDKHHITHYCAVLPSCVEEESRINHWFVVVLKLMCNRSFNRSTVLGQYRHVNVRWI